MTRSQPTVLIKNAKIHTMNADGQILRGNILVAGSRIAYVGRELPPIKADTTVDAMGNLVLPGFSNVHTHLPMSLLRGAGEDLPLMEWLMRRIFPLEDKLNDELAYIGSMVSIMEMIRTGTTSLADMYFFCDGIAQAICDSGIRANISRCVIGPDMKAAGELLDDAVHIYDKWNNCADGRLQVGFSVQGEYIAGIDVMKKVAETAKECNAVMQIHVSETLDEHEQCKKRHGGKTPFALLEEIGVLDVPVIAAHCVWITEQDMDMIKNRNVTVATCPKSNLKLGSGVAKVAAMLEKGVKVALGTDGAASNNALDMLEEMRYMALLQKGVNRDPSLMGIDDTLRIATANGANAMGTQAGAIEQGKLADLIMVDTHSSRFLPKENENAHLLYSANGSDVCLTMINGKIVYQDGKFLYFDEQKLMQEFCRGAQVLYQKQ